MQPNYQNQLIMARNVLRDQGAQALLNPHVMTGRICGCKDCFCCAALAVYKEHIKVNA